MPSIDIAGKLAATASRDAGNPSVEGLKPPPSGARCSTHRVQPKVALTVIVGLSTCVRLVTPCQRLSGTPFSGPAGLFAPKYGAPTVRNCRFCDQRVKNRVLSVKL